MTAQHCDTGNVQCTMGMGSNVMHKYSIFKAGQMCSTANDDYAMKECTVTPEVLPRPLLYGQHFMFILNTALIGLDISTTKFNYIHLL